ncbi:unnamed protein product, partial [Symbiodinium pilosum]
KGEKPKVKGKEVDQAMVDSLIHEHKCGISRFYAEMSQYRRAEMLCKGILLTSAGHEESVLVPSNGPTMLLEGTEVRFHTKYYGRNLTIMQALSDKFFETPMFGTGSKKPMILQRRRSTTCTDDDHCGHGWELALLDGEGSKTY